MTGYVRGMAIKHAWDLVAEAESRIENLDVDQVAAELAAGTAVVLDIRDIRELLELGSIPGSIHAPRGMLEFWVDPDTEYYRDLFDPAKRYILFCAAGGRSALSADTMRMQGYENVAHLRGGFGAWKAAGQPISDVASKSKWMKRPS